ncbi:hypothetical protein MRX96_007470 [Rhipicephalus microplus]
MPRAAGEPSLVPFLLLCALSPSLPSEAFAALAVPSLAAVGGECLKGAPCPTPSSFLGFLRRRSGCSARLAWVHAPAGASLGHARDAAHPARISTSARRGNGSRDSWQASLATLTRSSRLHWEEEGWREKACGNGGGKSHSARPLCCCPPRSRWV